MQMKEKIHIGKLIQRTLKENSHSVVWLAQQTGYNRALLYRIFNNPDIDTEKLRKFAEILHHDFFADCSAHFIENQSVDAKV
ncbi:hypothetical protein AGMMS4957_20800 [Bacteroidia bacterium]|nr:hypothetical protein AGMMS4957_20800 [Bacteroidia bacterium]